MRRSLKALVTAAAPLLALVIVAPACACGAPGDEGFAILLPAPQSSFSQLPALEEIELADAPLLSSDDITEDGGTD